jgi:hypothetical protein
MKKLVLLAGIVAAGFGAFKLLRGKGEDEFASNEPLYTPPAYTPEAQGSQG